MNFNEYVGKASEFFFDIKNKSIVFNGDVLKDYFYYGGWLYMEMDNRELAKKMLVRFVENCINKYNKNNKRTLEQYVVIEVEKYRKRCVTALRSNNYYVCSRCYAIVQRYAPSIGRNYNWKYCKKCKEEISR